MAWVTHCVEISQRKDAEDRLNWQATHDALTGLPNRDLFRRRLSDALEQRPVAERDGGVAVLFVDLDDFKDVNDLLGHGAGDRLLVAVAERLRGALRPEDVIARFGGDEFTILLPGVRSRHDAECVAARLAEALRHPLKLDGERIYVSASVGLALSGPDRGACDPETVVRNADTAMYQAKRLGKGRFAIFADSMRDDASERIELEGALRGALERDELRLVFQPLVALDDTRMIGLEALLRWDHPELGVVPPLRFIPLAEANGMIVPIGAWVLHEACRQLVTFGDESLTMSVNVSARQLEAGGFVEVVRSALEETGVAPHRLRLEITESAMLSDAGTLADVLTELKAAGVGLAVDDFGVGHASLRHLRALLPLDTLKIDKSFVDGIVDHPEDAAIVEGVVRLAHSLGLEAVAEGVETAEQAALLRTWNCQTGQGFHFGRPGDATQVTRLLDAAAT